MTTDPDETRPVPRDLRHSQERTLGQLVAQVTDDFSVIVRKEIQLAKTELASQIGVLGKGVGMLVGAGVVALYALGLLFLTVALVIAIWLPVWAGFLIVTVALFIVAAVLALVGRRSVNEANLRPERTIASTQATIAAVKGSAAAGVDHAAAVPTANSQVSLDERPTRR